MKEYTYTNKAYLGVKEGVTPPAPQYLWLNSKDDKLYKFGNNGWEVTNNAPYIVEDFTGREIASLLTQKTPKLTISRDFLDAMYKGVPIMVKSSSIQGATVPINVDLIGDPSVSTRFQFRVKIENTELMVSGMGGVLSGNASMNVTVTLHNSADWNENEEAAIGYIANRTHYLDIAYQFKPGQTISLQLPLGFFDIEDYRIKIGENLYKLPKTKLPVTIGSSSMNITLELTSISNNNGRLLYTYNTKNFVGISTENPSYIYRLSKPLDSVYLHNEALTWNYKTAQVSNSSVKFNTINVGDTLYNKDLVMIDASRVVDRLDIEIGTEHHRPNSIKEYTFIVYNNTTEVSPKVFFARGVGGGFMPDSMVVGTASPNCEIHVKLLASETSTIAVIEYKPFN